MNKKIVGIIGILVVGMIVVAIIVFAGTGEEKKETFTIGLDDSFPPMGFRNEENEIVGYDIDVAKAICEKLGLELKIQPISWAAKEEELNSGNIDCIWNGFAITEEREKTMTLSSVYLKGGAIFIVNPDINLLKQEDLKGKRVGVQNGSTQQKDLETTDFGKSLGEVITYGDYLTALMDLETGRIDAVYMSRISGNYIIKSKNKNFKTIESEGINSSKGMVIAFKKENTELRDKVQNTLEELKEEGVLKQISEKWFGEDLTLVSN